MSTENNNNTKDETSEVVISSTSTSSTHTDYTRLIHSFGAEVITDDLLLSIEAITKRPVHHFLRRQIFYSHRDLIPLLQCHLRGVPFYLYTGRGPSSESMHLGHLVPFLFTRYLQEAFQVPVVIQMTDDEKYLVNNHLTLEQSHANTFTNVKDIIACEFDPALTFIFSNLDYIGAMYRNIVKLQKLFTLKQIQGTFGFQCGCNNGSSDSIGRWAFPVIQMAPAFASSFPVLFPKTVSTRRTLISMRLRSGLVFPSGA